MIKVLIASESEVMRAGLESLIHSDPSLDLLGSLNDFLALDQSVEETAPDVVLLAPDSGALVDLDRPGGVDAARHSAVVVLGSSAPGFSPDEMLRSGVSGLLPQNASAAEILAAIHAVAAGLFVLHPAMAEREGRPRDPGAPVSPLSPRELEVLTMLADGLGNKEIAWRLKISEHTVKFHISSIFTKLDVSSRAEAVSLGFRLGLILV